MTLLYFAWVREKVGISQENVTPPDTVRTVDDLITWVSARSAKHADAFSDRKLVKVAVDQVHANARADIQGAKEVAFFPPVTGG